MQPPPDYVGPALLTGRRAIGLHLHGRGNPPAKAVAEAPQAFNPAARRLPRFEPQELADRLAAYGAGR